MKRLLLAAVLLSSACQTMTPREDLTSAVTLEVQAHDAGTGAFTLMLRNRSTRDVYFLHYLLEFSDDPQPRRGPRPDYQMDDPQVVIGFHDRLLKRGESFQIDSSYRGAGEGDPSRTFAGVHACWSNSHWECEHYTMLWSDKPINAD
jgi:hypothetical protein